MKGEMTVFFSLVFILLISFTGAVLESASLQTIKNERREDTSLAMDSVFAEYQKELFEGYGIFALDGSYGSGEFSEEAVGKRLNDYADMQATQKFTRIQLLTDGNGQAFYEQALKDAGNHYGLDVLEKAVQLKDLWKETEESLEEDPEQKMDQTFAEAEGVLPEDENELGAILDLRRRTLAQQVLPEGKEMSGRQIPVSELPSHRQLKKGKGSFKSQVLVNDTVSAAMFLTYLEEHFGNAVKPKEERGLEYELEYLLCGKPMDRDNLNDVVKKILWIRLACNFGYLQTDGERKSQAELWAAAISTLLLVPESEELVCQALLMAWAYAESVQDLRCLLAGKRVPFWKDSAKWQTGLASLISFGRNKTLPDGEGEGFSYLDYLRSLYLLADKKEVRMRALDLIEQNIRMKEESSFFRADACAVKLEAETTCRFRRGITYRFKSYYEYQ